MFTIACCLVEQLWLELVCVSVSGYTHVFVHVSVVSEHFVPSGGGPSVTRVNQQRQIFSDARRLVTVLQLAHTRTHTNIISINSARTQL